MNDSVIQYGPKGNTKEIKNIGSTMFKDIAGFLDDMLKVNDNSELRKDRDACVEAVKILTNI